MNVNELAQTSFGIQGQDYANKDFNVALLSFYPINDQYKSEENDQSLSIKILVDCSGSMAGDSIQSVANTLGCVIDEFRPDDRYSLTKFGTRVEHRSRSLWKVSDASLRAAQWWAKNLKADMGGTELERALNSTIRQVSESAADILLITDGEVYDIDSIIESARSSRQRIFVVGIGSSPVESHIRRLSTATAGACEFIAPGEDVKPAVLRMLSRIRRQTYENLRVKWPKDAQIKYETDINDALCNGDAFNHFAWIKGPVTGTVALVASSKEKSEEIIVAEVEINEVSTSDVISRIGAYERLKSDEVGNLELALEYQLLSDKTSMLLEHVRVSKHKQTDMPHAYKIAQMVPAGWAGMGSVVDVVRRMNMFPFGDEFSRRGSTEHVKKRIQKILEQNLIDSQTNPAIEKPKRKISITDRQNPLLWTDPNDRYGFTPMGLSEWLISNEGLYLIGELELLNLMGVPPSVIDWLELCFINEQGVACDEELIVAVFVSVMRSSLTIDFLKGAVSSDEWFNDLSVRLEKKYKVKTWSITPLNGINKLLLSLREMTATAWPISVKKYNDPL